MLKPFSMTVTDVNVLRFVPRSRVAAVIARILVVFLTITAVVMSCAPWQQNAQGSGRVIAYAPVERQQSVEAPIAGRVTHWHVQEGDHVEKGADVVEIVDTDPDILLRLGQEREAQRARIEAANARVAAIVGRIASLTASRGAAMRAGDGRARMAGDRITAAERATHASEQQVETARLNQDRQRALVGEGLASKRVVEVADFEMVRARTELDRARATESAARSEESALIADRMRAETDGAAAINDAMASRASAESDIASAAAELARIEVRLARQQTQGVKAPRSGTVLRVVAKQGGEMVKEGDVLAVLVPDTQDRAVELWIDGNDVPLVTPGRAVRLQFEGWPAVQFSGWPEVAVGTFSGKVAFVDAADDGKGRFRVLVVPDGKERWPAVRFLRQGSRAKGWILLDSVRLGYEVWRTFNGFPPVFPTKEMYDEPAAGGASKEEKK